MMDDSTFISLVSSIAQDQGAQRSLRSKDRTEKTGFADGALLEIQESSSFISDDGGNECEFIALRRAAFIRYLYDENETSSVTKALTYSVGVQREDISNYRPISLLSVAYKIFTRILLNRMERILDDNQPVEQAGFRKNFSCMEQSQTVTQLIERSREYHIPLVLVFVDHRKAFDSVEINAVLNALVHAGVPSPYVQFLDECFSNTSTTIQLFDRKLTIHIEKGVRQGDTISPKLFTAALQDAMKNLDWDAKGYPVDCKRISNLRFADDIVLISNSTAEAEEMLSELNMADRKIGLDMNMSKTQFMVNQWCDTGLVKLNGVALQRVDSYVYLGRELNMENDLAPEIARRRRAAWADFSSIREVTDRVKDAGLRASIFNASSTSRDSKDMNVRLQDDDVQICRAHERIHALNREILLHGDTAAQIAALMRKIAISKARAQDIVSMVR
ncbi:hypothetical protein Q1695_009352 [Nippostrongylus brasiliensis]|nr:hypothetical protein Q1695_009352 [Nippostrongylus brasiliensis]